MPPLRSVATTLVLGLVLAPALLLTALRLVQPGAGWAVRTVSFAPFAIPLYAAAAVALLVLLARAASARAGARALSLRAAALLVSLVLGLLHVTWVLPAFTGAVPTPAAGTPRLRVLTHNVLHDGGTASDIERLVADMEPDVVVLQEVTRALWRDLRSGAVHRALPHVAGLAADGPHETVVLARRALGRAQPLPTVGDCLLVPVRLGERTIDLMAAHPRYPERPTAWREDHATIAAAVRRARPALLVGDFNATYDHGTMRRYRDLGYRSATELLNSGWMPTWPDNGHRAVVGLPLPRVVQIDHVMVSRTLTALTVDHLEMPRSDHVAVVAEVALR